jgi:predicted transcriptional regulator
MKRRDTILILEDILKVLKQEKELSFNQVQKKTSTQWRTMKKCIDFLSKTNLITERRGDGVPNPERLFSLR